MTTALVIATYSKIKSWKTVRVDLTLFLAYRKVKVPIQTLKIPVLESLQSPP